MDKITLRIYLLIEPTITLQALEDFFNELCSKVAEMHHDITISITGKNEDAEDTEEIKGESK